MPSHSNNSKSQRSLAYQKLLISLQRELKFSDDETKAQLYDEFSEKYFLTKELWMKRLRLAENSYDKSMILKKAMAHFYYDEDTFVNRHVRVSNCRVNLKS